MLPKSRIDSVTGFTNSRRSSTRPTNTAMTPAPIPLRNSPNGKNLDRYPPTPRALFKALGVGGYLSKFFPFGEFRKGIGAGVIAVFVGLVELLLEFVKPVTLSMRLFGNIYGGEVALGVMTALTVALIPLGLFALEVMLNLVQALIFSTLTLMFTLAAIEHHADGDHETHEPTATPTDPALTTAGAH